MRAVPSDDTAAILAAVEEVKRREAAVAVLVPAAARAMRTEARVRAEAEELEPLERRRVLAAAAARRAGRERRLEAAREALEEAREELNAALEGFPELGPEPPPAVELAAPEPEPELAPEPEPPAVPADLPAAPLAPHHGYTHLRRAGSTLARHSGIYAAGRGIVLVVALVQALALVQFMGPGSFGSAAVLLTTASLVSLVLGLLFRRGAVNRTFGRHADADDDGDEDEEEDDRPATARDPRRALGTGMVLVVAAGVPLALLLGGLAALLGDDAPADLTPGWALAAGGVGVLLALWDILIVIPYLLRRPWAFVGAHAARPVATLAIAVPLVATGAGVWGVLVGHLAALTVCLAGALVAFRSTYSLHADRDEVRPIMRLSRQRWARHLALWVLRNGDLLLLAWVVAPATVGTYRVAGRLTAPVAFPVGAFFEAWLPLERGPLVRAAYQARGREEVRATVTTYLAIAICLALLGLVVAVELVGRVLPASYDGAVPLVPWLAGVALALVLLKIVHRFARMSARRVTYDRTVVAAALASIPATLAGAQLAGAEGAAAGNIAVVLAGTGFLWFRSQRGAAPLPLEWGRIAASVAVAAVLGAAGLVAASGSGSAGLVVGMVALVAYVPLLVVLGVVPREHRAGFRRIRRELRAERADIELDDAIAELDPADQSALALALATGTEDAGRAALAVLRRCTGIPEHPPDVEHRLADFLFGEASYLERHHATFALYSARVSPAELVELERWHAAARRTLARP